MRYVVARIEEYNREMAYRIYVTDSLQGIPQGKYTTVRFYDMLYSKEEEEEKTAEEIVQDVVQKAGLILR